MRREITVLVDTREKLPILFPETLVIRGKGRIVTVRRKTLRVGDYKLQGAERQVVVERKGSLPEIAKNMLDSNDRIRQFAAFDRLAAAAEYPILLLERTPGHLLRPSTYAPDPGRAVDALLEATMSRGIHLWLVGQCSLAAKRRLVGELLLRAMVVFVERREE